MSKLSISFKKYESYFTIFIGTKELISKSGTSIKFKNLRLVEKCINKLKSFSTYDEIYNSNLIKFFFFSVELNEKALHSNITNILETDTVLYRGNKGEKLEIFQKKNWDPLIKYVEINYKMVFKIQYGIMPVVQDTNNKVILLSYLSKLSSKRLTIFYFLTKLTNSVIITMNFLDSIINKEKAWELANIEDNYNVLEWGEDKEQKDRFLLKKTFYVDIINFKNLIT